MSAIDVLRRLEFKQLKHDENYHKDVWVLSTQDKARHMAAHIGKYSGQVLEAIRIRENEETIKKKIVDSLIINLSYANIFLSLISKQKFIKDHLDSVNFDEFIHSIGKEYIHQKNYDDKENINLELAMDFCILAGKILKTVESMDHMEIHPYRESYNEYASSIFKILSALCKKFDIKEIEKQIEIRLYGVEQNNPYFMFLGNYKDGYKN